MNGDGAVFQSNAGFMSKVGACSSGCTSCSIFILSSSLDRWRFSRKLEPTDVLAIGHCPTGTFSCARGFSFFLSGFPIVPKGLSAI